MHFKPPAHIVFFIGLIREYDQCNVKVSKYRHWCTTRERKRFKKKKKAMHAWHFKTLAFERLFTINWFLKEFCGKVNSEMFGSALAVCQNI